MTPSARVRCYGLAGLFVIAGIVIAVLFASVTAEALAISLISVGLIAVVSLMFFEVGCSEDRERERERRLAAEHPPPEPPSRAPPERRLMPSRRRRRRR